MAKLDFKVDSATIGNVSNTELGYLDGTTSAIQTQIASKANSANPTFTGTVNIPASSALSAGTPFSNEVISRYVILSGGPSFGYTPTATATTNAAISTDGITWTATTMPASSGWGGLAFGNSTLVAVGFSSSSAATSTDGLTWTLRTLPSVAKWGALRYGAGKFVALRTSGDTGTTAVYSTDGITWVQTTLPSNTTWRVLEYGNGFFLAAANGTTAISTDGITWTAGGTSTQGTVTMWESAFGDGKFVVGPGEAPMNFAQMRYSTDGITWTLGTSPNGGPYFSIFSLEYAFNKWWSSQTIANGTVYVSTNLTTWTTTAVGSGKITYIKKFGDRLFAIPGDNSSLTPTTTAYTSTDGITWTTVTMPNTGIWRAGSAITQTVTGTTPLSITGALSISGAITANSITKTGGTSSQFLKADGSVDSTAYAPLASPTFTGTLSAANPTFAGTLSAANPTFSISETRYFSLSGARGGSATTTAAYSTDGITWTATTMPASALWQMSAYGNNTIVAISYNSTTAATSTDAITWTLRTLPSSSTWSTIKFGSGRFVTLPGFTAGTTAAYSTDGITWTATTMPASSQWRLLEYGNNIFLAKAANNTTAATSTDGITWALRTSSASVFPATEYNSAFGNGVFVFLSGGANDAGIYTTDGITWGTFTAGFNASSVAYGAGRFIINELGTLTTQSTNGISWTEISPNINIGLDTIAYTGSRFVATNSMASPGAPAATSNTRVSTDGITWTLATLPATSRWSGSNSVTETKSISSNELSYLDGVTSAIQTQINAKANSASPTFTGTTSIQQILEKATVSATAATGTINYDLLTNGAVTYYTTNASGNWTLNVRGDGSNTLNSLMATGQSLTIAFLVTNGATAYYPTAFQVDGAAITPRWQGGTAPSSGNVNSIDIYSYTIIKTAASTYTVFASQTKFA